MERFTNAENITAFVANDPRRSIFLIEPIALRLINYLVLCRVIFLKQI